MRPCNHHMNTEEEARKGNRWAWNPGPLFLFFMADALVCQDTISRVVYQCTRQWECLRLLGRMLQSSAQFCLDGGKLLCTKHLFGVLNGSAPCHFILLAAMLQLLHNLCCLLHGVEGNWTELYIFFLVVFWCCQYPHYIASNGKMTDEWWSAKDLGGSSWVYLGICLEGLRKTIRNIM
jgi:hypothetical protein